MGAQEILFRDSEDIWEKLYQHPFVQGIATGTLDEEKFRFYLWQDYHYLLNYARIFSMGVIKATGNEKAMRAFAFSAYNALYGEMEIHKSYMARFGITEDMIHQVKPSMLNTSYTSYMLSVATGEGPAEVVAAITPCALSYGHLARRIVKDFPNAANHPLFGEWVDSYASGKYAQANRELCALQDELAAGYTDEQIAHLSEIFRNGSLYELKFWEMAWNMDME